MPSSPAGCAASAGQWHSAWRARAAGCWRLAISRPTSPKSSARSPTPSPAASHPLIADLRRAEECDRVVAAAEARLGGVDILVNNAGLTFTYIDPARYRRPTIAAVLGVGDEIVENVIAINYLAGDRLARRTAPGMVARGWGRIVNVTTKLDTMNRAGTHPYGASKAALEMASEVWAKEAEGTGLTINIVNPGAGANTPAWPRKCAR